MDRAKRNYNLKPLVSTLKVIGYSKRIFVSLAAVISLMLSQSIIPLVSAESCPQGMSQLDCDAIQGDWVDWVPGDGIVACGGTGATTSTGGGAAGGTYSLDQVKAFASASIASTWNIPDSIVEQWFLKQSGALATITKYGLTPSNIGEITSAVKAANVSPVFFYLYAVNEGGGAGGFINHYGSDIAGGGPANAARDAQYIADYSKDMSQTPSWIDAGHPVDFVPQAIKDAGNADFKSMPSGTIGRVYIPATAAATWEVYYPNGLKKQYNQVQDYGAPLSAAMQNIQSMGSDPLYGGATISEGGCTPGGVAGQGITKAINWAVMIANNDGYGYDQDTRTSGWAKWQADPSCTNQCGSFDCSSFVAAALTEAGYFATNPNFATGTEASDLIGAGFKQVASSALTSADLLPGDVLLSADHTAIYIGNNQMVAASINENGTGTGGQVGDQTGREVYVEPFNTSHNWIGVYRAQN